MVEVDLGSHFAFILVLSLQWFFIGLSLILTAYDFVEYARTKMKRYVSYGIGRLGFVAMVGVISYLLVQSPVHSTPISLYYLVWVSGIVLIAQSLIIRAWEIRSRRKEDEEHD